MNVKDRNILVYVEDIANLALAIDLSQGYYGYAVHFASSLEEVCEILRRRHVERVITDLSMISTDRCSLLTRVHQLSPAATIMILTGEEGAADILLPAAYKVPGYCVVQPGFLEAAHLQ